jgi:hypothetical protein
VASGSVLGVCEMAGVGIWVVEGVGVYADDRKGILVLVSVGLGPGDVQAQIKKARSMYKPMCR